MKTRIAICQIACHPAIYCGQLMWLEEPFVPPNKSCSLSNLSLKGFDVNHVLGFCKNTYIDWQTKRIIGILKYLKEIEPSPEIVVFPEGSIPFQCLKHLHNYSSNTGKSVFSGTHSYLNIKELNQVYKSIGISEKSIKKFRTKTSYLSGIAPIFVGNKSHLIRKKILSPFEKTDITDLDVTPEKINPFLIYTDDNKIPVLVLICAEALNFINLKITGDYKICTILSYDTDPEKFDNIIGILSANKKIVAYCNDGRFGGSSISLPIDQRSSFWWFDSNLHGKLPKGDGILIADVDTKNIGIEVGVTSPNKNFRLVKLSSITYKGDNDYYSVANEIVRIGRFTDSNSRKLALQDLLDKKISNILQKSRIDYLKHLANNGQDTQDWWNAIGDDCILDLPSLEQIECEMSGYAYSELINNLLDLEKTRNGIDELREFLKHAHSLSNKRLAKVSTKTEFETVINVIDRDEDSKDILLFLDDTNLKIAQILGMPQIGKSAVIRKALAQYRNFKINEITLQDTSTANFIAHKIVVNPHTVNEFSFDKNYSDIKQEDVDESLNSINLLWIHNAQNLVRYDKFINSEIESLIIKIIAAAEKYNVKVIFESSKELPIELTDATIHYKKRIYGLERRYLAHGISFFDYQLRRVGIPTINITIPTKEEIVKKLGGHPVALAFCADAISDDELTSVLDALKNKKGFYLNFINSLMKRINLCEEEKIILKLLSGSRIPVPREVILGSIEKTVAPYLRNLIQACLIEIDSSSNIMLPGLISYYFDFDMLPEETKNKFHELCVKTYTNLFFKDKSKIEYAIEADYHATLGKIKSNLSEALIDSQYAVAMRYYNNQNFKEAKTIIDKILLVKKTDDILRLSALIDAKNNLFDTAIEKAQHVFKKNPRDTWLLSEIARAALSQGRDDIAEELIATAKRANMEDSSILTVSGRMYLRRGDLISAKDDFKKACEDTRNAWPYFFLGKTYIKLGRIDKAIDILFDGEKFIYEKSIKNERVLTAIRTQLSIAYVLSDNEDSALPILENLIQEYTDDPDVMRAYAFYCLKKEGITEAHEAFKKLKQVKIRSRFDRSQYHLYYGLFLLNIGEKGKASQEFSEAHKADKNNVYVMMKLARTYYDLTTEIWIDGDIELAKTYANDCAVVVKKILEFDPDNYVGLGLQEDLYKKFGIEISKI